MDPVRLMVPDSTDDDVAQVRDALAAAGLPIGTEAVTRHRGVAELAVALAIVTPIGQFCSAFATQAGQDAYRKLAQVIAARRKRVLVEDSAAGTILLQPAEDGEAAVRAAERVDLGAVAEAAFAWDAHAGRWSARLGRGREPR